jgi:extradiol dioxygenase family protein
LYFTRYNLNLQKVVIMKSIFHLAFNVNDLNEARVFYGGLLGCKEGRSTETWVDFDFFNHQISLHLGEPFKTEMTGKVGEHLVPMPHLGVILDIQTWKNFTKKLEKSKVEFLIKPAIRFKGDIGEQSTMFFYDPFGNPIEIKGFNNFDTVYTS